MTTYDEYLQQVKEQHNLNAKTVLKRLYELLKIEDPLMSKDDMYDRIVKDCLEIWQRQTIRNNMPDELKDPERVETGTKARDRRKPIIVTAGSSVATESVANDFTNNNNTVEDPSKWTFISKKDSHQRSPPIQIDAQILERLKEELKEEKALRAEDAKRYEEHIKEQKDQFAELVKSTNLLAAQKKNTNVTESVEYKSKESELFIANQRIAELEEILKKDIATNPAIGFQNATALQPKSNESAAATKISNEVEFPAKDLSTFFLDQRQAKQCMYLKIEGNKVIGWESDSKRSGRK